MSGALPGGALPVAAGVTEVAAPSGRVTAQITATAANIPSTATTRQGVKAEAPGADPDATAVPAAGAPQCTQKAFPAVIAFPHDTQASGPMGAPHEVQNFPVD